MRYKLTDEYDFSDTFLPNEDKKIGDKSGLTCVTLRGIESGRVFKVNPKLIDFVIYDRVDKSVEVHTQHHNVMRVTKRSWNKAVKEYFPLWVV